MLIIITKNILLFTIGIIIMRIMGKSAITQLTPYDLMAIIIIGTIISEPLISTEIKPTIISLASLILFYIIYSKLSLNQIFNKFLLGEPTILIKQGKIDEKNLEKEHISLIQLTSILRTNGYPKLDDVEYAILEPTGEISIIPKSSVRNVSISDLNIPVEPEKLPIAVIIDGKIQKKNLKLIHKDEKWLNNKLKEENIDLKDVIYAYSIEEKEEVYFDVKSKK
ncbi:DUF421 domain-containing protein [Tepidibacter formicigenes]|jgi:uncharacterized membrane protein YcaP (DUF421 family)|uniref:Uncharacterized membrane protein YcaP, DUF421 family n=1 Tax=Tepidibacter formicigenes DSM 15518 TaxID=1123349 RepID=A0A1M6R955_9FIRM|nr:DUF421 domain-containing protein [Tepidibacter formicigenes]SHK28858.1 Uncharacterized membrane protein YcaP, DUF421 family [Tepidibacter formicigenes DSM 15518]